MKWRVADSLLKLRAQVNERWPTRNKENDGTIGDADHASRSSDHNPWVKDDHGTGVVTAMDITHDPKSGCDSYALAELFRASRDPRIKYIISNHRICSAEVSPWEWRPYHGANPHDHHVHLSVKDEARLYDDQRPWDLDARAMPAPVGIVIARPPTLKLDAHGDAVSDLQRQLGLKGILIAIDGVYGPATKAAVRKFQQARGLIADGICGPQTWAALGK